MTASFIPAVMFRNKRWLVFFWIAFISLNLQGQTTLYSYQSGAWDNIDVWTTDPGGTTLVGSKIPGNNDAVVILSSRTVNLTGNITNTGLGITIQSGGVLDASSFAFTNTLTILAGQGTYRLKSSNFPAATSNTFRLNGGGTVEYYNDADFTMPAAQAIYNNLKINCSGFIATQLNDLTINGNLEIQGGTFRINNGSAVRLTLVVKGNVSVSTGAFFLTGTGNTTTTTDPCSTGTGGTSPFLDYYVAQSHRVEIYGDFTNNGTVRFTNQTYPVFDTFPTDGFASVYFRGAADKTLTCNGQTDFYNIIIDKGTDQTYTLSINSADYNKFRIFGANVAGEIVVADASNPDIRKALWVRNGTLLLNGKVFIPSLVEGASAGSGDFIIPGNGALVIGGPDVIVMGTIDNYSVVDLAYGVGGSGVIRGVTTGATVVPSGISLYGKLQVNEGKLYIGELGRIVYYGSSAAAQFMINGGVIDIKQFQAVAGGGKTAFWQTGGALVLRGRFQRSLVYSSQANLISSIGNPSQLNLTRLAGPNPGSGTLNIDQPDNIFHMENGTIDILDVTGSAGNPNALEVNSDPSNVNVTGGTITINMLSGSVPAEDTDYGISSTAPLYNVTITRTSGSKKVVLKRSFQTYNNLILGNTSGVAGTVLDAVNNNITVGGNFIIQNNAVFVPGDNRTILNGSGVQTFNNQGAITSGLYRLIVDKNSGTVTLGSNLTVRDSLKILGGTLNDGNNTIQVGGSVYNAGTHSGNGKIVFNGIARQFIDATASAQFGNIELNSSYNTAPYLALNLNTDISVQTVKLNGDQGVFYLNNKALIIRNQGIYLGKSSVPYSVTKMFMTDGSHSAKGINLYLSLTGNLNLDIDTIPLGVYHLGTTAWYTPMIINVKGNLGSTSYTGTLNYVPVDFAHPSSDPTKPEDVIPFYWKVKTAGTISSVATSFITYKFYNNNVTHPGGSKLAYLEEGKTDWVWGANSSDPLNFNVGFISGAFSAGKNPSFNAPVYCRARASGFWDQAGTWTPRVPRSYDYVIIGGSGGTNYTVTIQNSNTTLKPDCAGLSIFANGLSGDVAKPTLVVNAGLTGLNFTTVAGGGKLILKGNSSLNLPAGDFGFFCNNDTAIFEYNDDGAAGSNYVLPSSIRSYPNLHITNSRNNLTRTLPDADITVLKNLRLYSTFTGNKLIFNNSANAHFLTVNGNLDLSNASILEAPAAAGIKTINVYGNINFRYGNTDHVNVISAAQGTGVSHVLNFYGKYIYSGASSLTLNQPGTNKMNLYFRGTGPVIVTNGSGAFNVNRLLIERDLVTDTVYFRNNFTLNETCNTGPSKSLDLLRGILILSDPLNGTASTINLNLSSGGSSPFLINSGSGLILRNGATVNITDNAAGSGLKLDGLLKAEGTSVIDFANSSGTNNAFIEYSGSGNAILSLSGASVMRVGQVRRSLTLTTGILKYSQDGSSTVTIYGIENAGYVDVSRAKFEVTGSGSCFNMSGTSTISIINGGGTTFGDLYLRPGSSSVTGGSIVFGAGVSGIQYHMDANSPLNNLIISTIASSNQLQLMVNPLVLSGSLTIDNPCILTTNGINITIKGNMTNNGTYNAGSNTTIFSGTTQIISGSNDPQFMNLTASPSVKLSPSRDMTVTGALNITGGTLESTSHNISVAGNVTNNGSYTNDAAGTSRLYLNGSAVQHIGGTGNFGRIELNNAAGGAMLDNDLSLSEDITLTNGIFDINQYSLTLGPESDISPASFGPDRMFRSNGVYSDGGITKYFKSLYSGTFTFPFGVAGKYTPADLQVITTGTGYVRLNIINEKHPATLSPFNVLNYYWDCASSVTAFEGALQLNYSVSDVTGTESQYVAAQLIVPPGTGWSRAAAGPSTDNVNETTHVISFGFPAGTSNLGGQYTAGYTSDLPSAIPVYRSKNPTGNWNVKTDWDPESPDGGPNGCAIIIDAGTVMNTSTNKRFAYRTTINGTLNVGTTYGHNLGTVDGNGTLSLQQANLPAGDFKSFLRCTGGTLEYDGGSYTIVADRIDTVRNIIFKGTGTKTLPDKDLVICNQIVIDGPVLDNHFNRKLSVGGSFILTSGSFVSGTGAGATVTFNGTIPQSVTGFNSSNALNNLEINNSAGLTLGSDIDLNGNLILTNGIITTTPVYKVKMLNQSAVASGGSSSSFVNGCLSKNQFGGISFTFHVGKGTRYGNMTLINPQSGTWESEYYNSNFGDTDVDATLSGVSATEYWKITSPADAKTSAVQLRWDNLSDINPLTTAGGINDIKIAEYNGTLWTMKASSVPVGDNNNGTVLTSSNITINRTTHPYYYTLGSVSAVKPTINLGTVTPVCRCFSPAALTYISTSGQPDQYIIDFDAAANTAGFVDVSVWTGFTSSPISVVVPVNAPPGTYNAVLKVRKATVGLASQPYSFFLIVLADQRWTGGLGTDWGNTGNWLCGFLPDISAPVQIPAVANKPIIGAATVASVNNLTIDNGSSLVVNGTLQISGNIFNNGTLTSSGGKVVMNGSAAQSIGAGLFTGNQIKDLTVNNANGVSLLGPMKLTGILKLQSGNLTSSGYLTLVSNNAGTALIDGSGTGNVIGNVTMQRFLSSRFGYKYFSSPFQNATVNEFADEVDLTYWFPLFYAYDENRNYLGTPIQPFYNYSNPANVLAPIIGYAANFGAVTDTLTVDATGIVNNGSYSATLYNHNHPYALGRNLVGNPYPSPIDWVAPSGWTKTNIDSAVYYFKASTSDQWGGTYSSWVNGVSSDGIASNIIPSMQGFMVRVSTGAYPVTGTISMNNNVRVINTTQKFYKKSSYTNDKTLVRLSASFADQPSFSDYLTIYFDYKAGTDFDSQLDAVKYFNTDYEVPNFFAFGSDLSKLSIDAVPVTDKDVQSIPLGLTIYKSGDLIFKLKEISGPLYIGAVKLFDNFTGVVTDLSVDDEYTVTLNEGEYSNRFFLNFEDLSTGISAKEPESMPFRLYGSKGKLFAESSMLVGHEGLISISNLTGQTVFTAKIYENGHHEFNPGVNEGIYIVSFTTGNIRRSEKIYLGGR